MRRALVAFALLAVACHDFDQAFDECQARGHCDRDNMTMMTRVLDAGAAALSFGPVVLDELSPPQTVTVTNGGDAGTLGLTVGVNAAAFQVSANSCGGATLNPGASCTFQVRFQPAQLGAATGELTVSESSSLPVKVAVSGDGIGPAVLSIAPPSVDLGRLSPGAMGFFRDVTVTNAGPTTSAPLLLWVDGGSVFLLDAGTCAGAPLAVSASCSAAVAFRSSATGTFTGTLVAQGRPNEVATAALTGTALDPGGLYLAPPSHAFGDVDAGLMVTQNFVLTNDGGTTSPFTAALMNASPSYSITLDTCTAQPLDRGEQCAVQVAYAPARFNGVETGQLEIGALSGGTVSANLSGRGIDDVELFVGTATVDVGQGVAGSVVGPGFSCDAACAIPTRRFSTVALSARPAAGSRFAGWLGDCSGTDASCTLTVTGDAGVATASFLASQYTLQVVLQYDGGPQPAPRVMSSVGGLDCPGTCSVLVPFGTHVDVPVVTSPRRYGLRLSGCNDTRPTAKFCDVDMTRNVTLTGTLDVQPLAFVSSISAAPGPAGSLNTHCRNLALDAGVAVSGAFGNNAWMSGTGAPNAASTRVGPGPWLRTDGRPFADSLQNLLAGRLAYPLRVNERGVDVGRVNVATGTLASGSGANGGLDTCSDYTVSSTSPLEIGVSTVTGPQWTEFTTLTCNSALRFYCMQNLTDAGVGMLGFPPGSRRAFISETADTGDTDNAAMDALCRNEASDAGLPNVASYKGLRALAPNSAASRFNTGGGNWYRTDGYALFNAPTELASAGVPPQFLLPLNVTARGGPLLGQSAWFGANALGQPGPAAMQCTGWTRTDAGSGNNALVGTADDSFFLSGGSPLPCDTPQHFWCLED